MSTPVPVISRRYFLYTKMDDAGIDLKLHSELQGELDETQLAGPLKRIGGDLRKK